MIVLQESNCFSSHHVTDRSMKSTINDINSDTCPLSTLIQISGTIVMTGGVREVSKMYGSFQKSKFELDIHFLLPMLHELYLQRRAIETEGSSPSWIGESQNNITPRQYLEKKCFVVETTSWFIAFVFINFSIIPNSGKI